MKTYHEHVIDEIIELIKDNLILLYNYNDDALINMRKYCQTRDHKRYRHLDYSSLVYFTEEAIAELLNTDYFYDFRDELLLLKEN